jgi:hypothetical protein
VCSKDKTSIQLGIIKEVAALLAAHAIPHWLSGGWGIDFLVGAVTREHRDIDFVVWAIDADRVRALLETHGYHWQPTRHPDERHVFSKQNQRIDVDFIERTESGQIVTPGRWKVWPWPPNAFTDATASLEGIICPVVSAEAQLDSKESFQHYAPGTAMRDVDHADIARLRAALDAQAT